MRLPRARTYARGPSGFPRTLSVVQIGETGNSKPRHEFQERQTRVGTVVGGRLGSAALLAAADALREARLELSRACEHVRPMLSHNATATRAWVVGGQVGAEAERARLSQQAPEEAAAEAAGAAITRANAQSAVDAARLIVARADAEAVKVSLVSPSSHRSSRGPKSLALPNTSPESRASATATDKPSSRHSPTPMQASKISHAPATVARASHLRDDLLSRVAAPRRHRRYAAVRFEWLIAKDMRS